MAVCPLIQLEKVTKKFGDNIANDRVDLVGYKGEVHALLGENGAGKSTLMHLVAGMLTPNRGQIRLNGHPIRFRSAADAIHSGIGMVHQHFMLIDRFTVMENVILGNEPHLLGVLRLKHARKKVKRLIDQYGFNITPEDRVSRLSVGQKQQVEIMKTLFRDISLLILDEPTAALTPEETQSLFTIMHKLVDQGAGIIFISHKLTEVMTVAHRITVMRNGRVQRTVPASHTSEDELVRLMIGDAVLPMKQGFRKPTSSVRFYVRDLTVQDDQGIPVVNNLSLHVNEGEILGVAGVQGNGRTEMIEAITGLRPVLQGEMVLDGRTLPFADPKRIVAAGMAHVPEDRLKYGVFDRFSVADNLILHHYDRPPFSRFGLRRPHAVIENATTKIRDYHIRGASPHMQVYRLSGGNQQKLVVSRELSPEIRLLVAGQPTRGLDVGAVAAIHDRLLTLKNQGVPVILVSSDLDEILALSDRIVVIYQGNIIGECLREKASREDLGNLMSGRIPTPVSSSDRYVSRKYGRFLSDK